MQVIRSIGRMHSESRRLAAEGRTIGVVPTMGYLHRGHLSLMARAQKAADVVVATVFVNPAQFGPREDLSRYPRDEKGDIVKMREAGVGIAFIPRAEKMYPDEFQTFVTVDRLTQTLEGKHRPTHFRGVTTVVAKLFNIIRPDVAAFGMKDYQQAVVLRQMARDLGYPIKFIVAPTVRERDGLAMSSRNRYFGPDERLEARCLYYALRTAKAIVRAGERNPGTVRSEMRAVIRANCATAEIDYIAFTDFDTLKPVAEIHPGSVCSLAVQVHGVRLIDNTKL